MLSYRTSDDSDFPQAIGILSCEFRCKQAGRQRASYGFANGVIRLLGEVPGNPER